MDMNSDPESESNDPMDMGDGMDSGTDMGGGMDGGMDMGNGGHGDMADGGHGDTNNNSSMNMSGHHDMQMVSADAVIVEDVFLGVSLVIGVVCNIMVLVVLFSNKSLRSGTYILFFNLAFTGTVIAGFSMPLHVYTTQKPDNIKGSILCVIEAHTIAICALVGLFTHTLIAIIRLLAGVAHTKYKRIVTQRNVILMAASVWVFAAILETIGSVTNIVHPKFGNVYGRCTPVDMDDMDTILICAAFLVVIPYLIICFCYGKLFHTIQQSAKSMQTGNNKKNERFARVTKTLIFLSFLFIVGWLPIFIVCGLDRNHNTFPIIVHRFGHDIAEILYCIGPIFYFLRIDEFKVALKKMLKIPETSSEISSTGHNTHTKVKPVSFVQSTATKV